MLSQHKQAAPFDAPPARRVDAEGLYELLIANRFDEARAFALIGSAGWRVCDAVLDGRFQDAICDLAHEVIPQNWPALRQVIDWPPCGAPNTPQAAKARALRDRFPTPPHTLNLA